MYEVEYKVEITKEEKEGLDALFRKDGFVVYDAVTQNDYYIDVQESQFGGYDPKRYRDEGKNIFYTEKVWEEKNGIKARSEVEKEVSRGQFLEEIAKYPDALKIIKERQSYIGKYQNTKISVSIDSVKFDHSPSMRYFIEAEVLVENQEEIVIYKNLVVEFLKTTLNRNEIKEASGMFSMAFNKL